MYVWNILEDINKLLIVNFDAHIQKVEIHFSNINIMHIKIKWKTCLGLKECIWNYTLC